MKPTITELTAKFEEQKKVKAIRKAAIASLNATKKAQVQSKPSQKRIKPAAKKQQPKSIYNVEEFGKAYENVAKESQYVNGK